MISREYNWEDIIVSPEITIADAINIMNRTGRMFLLIADENLKLLGNLTDGDLRKGLIISNDLSSKISSIMNTKTKVISDDTSKIDVINLFQNSDFKALPVVDENNILKNCYFEDDFNKSFIHPYEMMIMAGGFGKRMGDLTKETPKPMLKVKGKPMLEHMINLAKEQGFSKIYISVYYLSEIIMSYFGDGKKFGVEIIYIEEHKPLGTAGSIKLLPEGSTPIVIVNADIFSEINFRSILEFHLLTDAYATIATHEYTIQNPFGVIQSDGINVVKLEEKPVWKTNVNAGIYVLNRQAQRYVNYGEFLDMPSLYGRILDDGEKVVQFPLNNKLFELGSYETYKDFINNISNHDS